MSRLVLGASPAGRPLYEALGFVGKDDEMVYERRSLDAAVRPSTGSG